jgi:hypothetical protein
MVISGMNGIFSHKYLKSGIVGVAGQLTEYDEEQWDMSKDLNPLSGFPTQ